MTYRQLPIRFGGRGEGPGRFWRTLRGLDIDKQDRLLAAGDSAIQVFAPTDGRLLARWSTEKPVYSVAVAPDGAVFAGEAGQIEIFRNGRLAAKWTDPALLGRISAIGFAGPNEVLVADAKDRCIRRYDARTGKWIANIGKNTRLGGFAVPNGVVDFGIDSRGTLHVANPGKHRVEQYTAEDKLLGHIGRFDGNDPAGFTGCCNPTNVAVAPNGNIYTAEKAGPRVKVYRRDGTLLAVIAGETAFDENCKNMDLAVDRRGRVYVADTVRLEILAFEETTT